MRAHNECLCALHVSAEASLMATGQPNKPTETRFKLSLNIVFPLLGGRSTLSHEHLLPIFVSLIVALMLAAVPFPGFI